MRVAATLLVLACFVASCSPYREVEDLASVRSPDEKHVAGVVRRTPPGGALARNNYYLVVEESGSKSNERLAERAVWASDGVYPVYVFWTSNNDLEVLISRDARENLTSIRSNPRAGFRVTTKILQSTLKQALCSGETLEAVLPE